MCTVCDFDTRDPREAEMKIFISWSGERSQALAQALRDWLPMVLHYAEPWLSKSDIEAGERWATEVAKELETTKFGIICVSRENIGSAWLLFEAGALAKSMQEARVIPLLLDIEFKDIAGPLAQFQAKKVEKLGLEGVTKSINQNADGKLPEVRLAAQFEALWPVLEAKVLAIPKASTQAKHNRPQSEVLEELVTSIRGLDLRFRETADEPPRWRRRRKFHPIMIEEMMHASKLGRRDPIRFLMLASVLRDDFPWLYELGVDAYRAANSGHREKAKEAQLRFAQAIKMLGRGPIFEMIGDKESHFFYREIMMMSEALMFDESDDDNSNAKLKLKDQQLPNKS